MKNGKNNFIDNLDPIFFGPVFRLAFLAMIFIELLSFTVFSLRFFVDLAPYILIITGLIAFFLTWKKTEWGLMLALAELFVGSKGQLFFWQTEGLKISWRMVIFLGVMLAFVLKNCRLVNIKKIGEYFRDNKAWWGLIFALLMGLVTALFFERGSAQIFFDFNAWWYFIYLLPVVLVAKKNAKINDFWQLLIAAVVLTSLKSLFFLYIFSHRFNLMRELYKWGRDTGYGEFTMLAGNYYRIFSQGHLIVLAGFLLIFGYLCFKGRLRYRQPKNQYLFLLLLAALSTLLMSLSRSFWVALAGAAPIAVYFAWRYHFFSLKEALIVLWRLVVLTGLAYLISVMVVNFPFPEPKIDSGAGAAMVERLTLSDEATSSRWSQLPHLFNAIGKHPLIGSGWGATITYQSQDPRILTLNNPEGWYTTAAFEWGYLDIIYKIGFLGFLAYAWVIAIIFRRLHALSKKNNDPYFRAILSGLSLSLSGVLIVHAFSPYLNHPLGIGWLLFTVLMLEYYENTLSDRESNR